MQDNNQKYRIGEVAKLLGMSKSWVYKHIKTGKIPCIRMCGTCWIPKSEVEKINTKGLK